MPAAQFWARTQLGIESIFLQELQSCFPLKSFLSSHKSIFFELAAEQVGPIPQLLQLSTADDIYTYLGNCSDVTRARASLEKIKAYFVAEVMPKLPSGSFPIRISTSFLGKRNFNRYEVEEMLNEELRRKKTQQVLSNQHNEPWVPGEKRLRIHIEDETAHFGLSLTDKPLHRRSWRVKSYDAQLHPTIAAAMARAANVPKGALVIDPFCGSGTILIESALMQAQAEFQGYDINPEAISIAREHAALAGTRVLFSPGIFEPSHLAQKFILLSNPPWGQKHEITDQDTASFFPRLIALIQQAESAVLLVPAEFSELIQANFGQTQRLAQTRVKGMLVDLVKITK